MTLALAEPASVATPEKYYSSGRIRHHFLHYRCCLSARKIPGSCINDPYDDERVRGTGPEPMQYSAADIFSDIYGVWAGTKKDEDGNVVDRMPRQLKLVLLSLYYIGPIVAGKEKWEDEYRSRQLAWWSRHRHRFNNIEPEYAIYLVDKATRKIAYELGWRPEKGEEQ